MQKVVTSNLNPLLKLFFYLPILTNNNLLFKIYCENIVVVFFNQDFLFFILFFFLSFPFHPYTFHFLFSFSCFSPLHKCPVSTPISIPPSFIFFFSSRTFQHLTFASHQREREIGLGLHRISSISTAIHCPPHHQAGSDRLVLFFFFSFFIFACSNSTLF